MLLHVSDNFRRPQRLRRHEPRAALFLNRFTRTLTIMYATRGSEDVLGLPGEQMIGCSFYHCISENCLLDSVKCLENVKAKKSLAYLRFWFRDPRQSDRFVGEKFGNSDQETSTSTSTDNHTDDGVRLAKHCGALNLECHGKHNSRASSKNRVEPESIHEAVFDDVHLAESLLSSPLPSLAEPSRSWQHSHEGPESEPIELEAFVSCTSDGLVVCLRRALCLVSTS